MNYLSAKNFIERLLQVDPKKRFTCKQALNHPWYVQFTNIRFIAFVVVFFNNIRTRLVGKWRQGIENTYIYRKKPGVLPAFFRPYSHSGLSGVHYWEGRPHIYGVLCLTCDMPGTRCFTINYWDIIQYQYLGNCPPTSPLTQQQSIDNKSRLMLG